MEMRGLSITGEQLDLSLCNTVQGRWLAQAMTSPTVLIFDSGACVSIDSFEKINKLGEGSEMQPLFQPI